MSNISKIQFRAVPVFTQDGKTYDVRVERSCPQLVEFQVQADSLREAEALAFYELQRDYWEPHLGWTNDPVNDRAVSELQYHNMAIELDRTDDDQPKEYVYLDDLDLSDCTTHDEPVSPIQAPALVDGVYRVENGVIVAKIGGEK